MFKKIFLAILLSVILALSVCFCLIFFAFYADISHERIRQLQNELDLVIRGVETGGMHYLRSLKLAHPRVTYVTADGAVKFDSTANSGLPENHISRSEIQQAVKFGSGRSNRMSDTLSERTVYLARRMENGDIVRLSVTHKSIGELTSELLPLILLILLLGIILSGFLARAMARRIVKPLDALDLDSPLKNETYSELSPLLQHINRQNQEIHAHLANIKKLTENFTLIASLLRDGLVLLDASHTIISINEAAKKFFAPCGEGDTIEHRLHCDALELTDAVKSSEIHGYAELQVKRNARFYHIGINPIVHEEHVSGYIMLIMDTTERSEAEQRRKEFSANVSHEFKTPLQSIMGYSELLKNGIATNDDIGAFSHKIYDEAVKMNHMIDNVMKISRLDEHGVFDETDFGIIDMIMEYIEETKHGSFGNNVTVSVEGKEIHVISSPYLMKSIIFNLVENAIKYNKPDGVVRIGVQNMEDRIKLTVSDSGIGFSGEEKENIFNRFYRIDRNRSGAIPGTGLGLSIVKHAVAQLKGNIEAESVPGEGSTFTVTLFKACLKFPK